MNKTFVNVYLMSNVAFSLCLSVVVIIIIQNKVNVQVLQKQIFPVSLFFAISLVLSNKAYIYLSVSYIQVCTVYYMLLFAARVVRFRKRRGENESKKGLLPYRWVCACLCVTVIVVAADRC